MVGSQSLSSHTVQCCVVLRAGWRDGKTDLPESRLVLLAVSGLLSAAAFFLPTAATVFGEDARHRYRRSRPPPPGRWSPRCSILPAASPLISAPSTSLPRGRAILGVVRSPAARPDEVCSVCCVLLAVKGRGTGDEVPGGLTQIPP